MKSIFQYDLALYVIVASLQAFVNSSCTAVHTRERSKEDVAKDTGILNYCEIHQSTNKHVTIRYDNVFRSEVTALPDTIKSMLIDAKNHTIELDSILKALDTKWHWVKKLTLFDFDLRDGRSEFMNQLDSLEEFSTVNCSIGSNQKILDRLHSNFQFRKISIQFSDITILPNSKILSKSRTWDFSSNGFVSLQKEQIPDSIEVWLYHNPLDSATQHWVDSLRKTWIKKYREEYKKNK